MFFCLFFYILNYCKTTCKKQDIWQPCRKEGLVRSLVNVNNHRRCVHHGERLGKQKWKRSDYYDFRVSGHGCYIYSIVIGLNYTMLLDNVLFTIKSSQPRTLKTCPKDQIIQSFSIFLQTILSVLHCQFRHLLNLK